jgi:hypothetical protein
MSYTLLHEKIKTARKEYYCDASENICAYGRLSDLMDDYKIPFSDRRKLAILEKENYKIFAGSRYLEQVGVYDGDFYCLKCRLDAVDIVRKYHLYED